MATISNDTTTSAKITELLREEIISGQLSEGQHVTIAEISAMFSVSQTPVREAFRALEGERLLEVIPYKGAIVRKIDGEFFFQVISVCDALEAYANEQVMKIITDERLAQLQTINEQILSLQNTSEDIIRHRELNRTFHSLIMQWAGNSIAQDLHTYYHKIAQMVRSKYYHSYERIQQVGREHQLIIDAFRDHDSFALKYATDLHARNARLNFHIRYLQSINNQEHFDAQNVPKTEEP